MFGWLVRVLLIVAGAITGWFVARDATNFGVLQMFVMLGLVTICVAALAFWSTLVSWFRGQR
jgi:FtsH-binding integral membrane protein